MVWIKFGCLPKALVRGLSLQSHMLMVNGLMLVVSKLRMETLSNCGVQKGSL